MTYTKGVDVSYYEPKINWNLVLSQGYFYMFTKASQGIGFVDSRFSKHWTGAKSAGLLRGAYHYLVASQDATRQANLFLATIGNDIGELPPVLDLEGKYNETASNRLILGAAEIWLNRVEKVTGVKPMIYSSYYYLRDHVSIPWLGTAPSWAKNYPLWIAQYPSQPATENDAPLQPKGWQNWIIWQHSEKGMLKGITNDDNIPTAVDLNYFRGSVADLAAFAGGKWPRTEPLPEPGDSPVDPGSPPSGPGGTPPSDGPTIYTVMSGDSLWSIAAKHNTTVTAIIRLNNLTNPDLIFVGQKLVIP